MILYKKWNLICTGNETRPRAFFHVVTFLWVKWCLKSGSFLCFKSDNQLINLDIDLSYLIWCKWLLKITFFFVLLQCVFSIQMERYNRNVDYSNHPSQQQGPTLTFRLHGQVSFIILFPKVYSRYTNRRNQICIIEEPCQLRS